MQGDQIKLYVYVGARKNAKLVRLYIRCKYQK